MFDLPTSFEIGGVNYAIRSDFRAILDICIALEDPELSKTDKALCAAEIFYPDFEKIPVSCYEEAIKRCFWFISCGDEQKESKKTPKLVDWERDFQYIAAPINRICGCEVRSVEYMHWWTFIAAFYEIGDCTFAQIVRIRDKKARGKPLDKADREWYRKNRHLVDIKTSYTETEKELLKMWGGA